MAPASAAAPRLRSHSATHPTHSLAALSRERLSLPAHPPLPSPQQLLAEPGKAGRTRGHLPSRIDGARDAPEGSCTSSAPYRRATRPSATHASHRRHGRRTARRRLARGGLRLARASKRQAPPPAPRESHPVGRTARIIWFRSAFRFLPVAVSILEQAATTATASDTSTPPALSVLLTSKVSGAAGLEDMTEQVGHCAAKSGSLGGGVCCWSERAAARIGARGGCQLSR